MNCSPDKPVKIVIASSPAYLPVVRGAVEKMCQLLGFDDEGAGGVVLSVDEALTNIIKHAYNGADDKPIDIDLAPLTESPAGGIRICLRDYGPSVDPEKIRSRDLDDIRPGGLGVHIMCECMDKLEYRRAEGGGTVLTMTKKAPERKGNVTR